MILDGNSRVGSAKVYVTALEMKQAKEIENKDRLIKSLRDRIQYFDNKYLEDSLYLIELADEILGNP